MPIKRIVYDCKFCNKHRLKDKERILKHEEYCFKNPKNKACKTCVFFSNKLRTNEERSFSKGNISRCSKLELMFYYGEGGCKTIQKGDNIIYQDEFFKPDTRDFIFPRRNCKLYKRKK